MLRARPGRDHRRAGRTGRLTRSFYPADLARIHDEGFGDFARAAVCELLPRLPASGLVVELGCGSGISSELIAAAGYEVHGIDLSADMLALARRRAPSGRFDHGSVWDAAIPGCVAVTAIGEVINYAADPRAGEAALPQLFARVHAALAPGGVFLFDFATPGRATLRADGGPAIREGDGWRIASYAVENRATKTLERHMTIEYDGRERTEVHTLRLYEPDGVARCLEGFSSEPLGGYCDFRFWPGYAAFAATKVG